MINILLVTPPDGGHILDSVGLLLRRVHSSENVSVDLLCVGGPLFRLSGNKPISRPSWINGKYIIANSPHIRSENIEEHLKSTYEFILMESLNIDNCYLVSMLARHGYLVVMATDDEVARRYGYYMSRAELKFDYMDLRKKYIFPQELEEAFEIVETWWAPSNPWGHMLKHNRRNNIDIIDKIFPFNNLVEAIDSPPTLKTDDTTYRYLLASPKPIVDEQSLRQKINTLGILNDSFNGNLMIFLPTLRNQITSNMNLDRRSKLLTLFETPIPSEIFQSYLKRSWFLLICGRGGGRTILEHIARGRPLLLHESDTKSPNAIQLKSMGFEVHPIEYLTDISDERMNYVNSVALKNRELMKFFLSDSIECFMKLCKIFQSPN